MAYSKIPFTPAQLERKDLGNQRFQEILDLMDEGYSQVLTNEHYRKIAEIAIKGIHCA